MSEQPLNSLERFRKRSSRLQLEAHDSSEVPAGCGGMVLRWRNPHRAVPLTVYLYSPGKATLFLDGAEVETAGVDLAPGPHQLALLLEDVNLGGGLFMIAGRHDADNYHAERPAGLAESSWRLVSQADRTWLASVDAALTDDWKRLDFDDTGWFRLERTEANPTLNWGDPGAHPAYWCNHLQAAFLALVFGRPRRGAVRVRKRFVVPSPEMR